MVYSQVTWFRNVATGGGGHALYRAGGIKVPCRDRFGLMTLLECLSSRTPGPDCFTGCGYMAFAGLHIHPATQGITFRNPTAADASCTAASPVHDVSIPQRRNRGNQIAPAGEPVVNGLLDSADRDGR